jgi:hypothetical protein
MPFGLWVAGSGNSKVEVRLVRFRDRACIFVPSTRPTVSPLCEQLWVNPFISGAHFLDERARNLVARTFYHFLALGISPARSLKLVGAGLQYTGIRGCRE